MVGLNGMSAVSAYAAQKDYGKSVQNQKTGVEGAGASATSEKGATKNVDAKNPQTAVKSVFSAVKKNSEYGKVVGEPKLSEKAQKYYEQLKSKFGSYDFILVSRDELENAKANSGRFANKFKTVVLIDEDKIEKMASDENYRKKYEGILSGAQAQLSQLKTSMEASGAKVKGYGMQVNDDGTTSFFAVLKKSSADQKARIEKKAQEHKAEKKAAEKKAQKKAEEKRLEELREKGRETVDESAEDDLFDEADEDLQVITASSMEELLRKMEEFSFQDLSDSVQTESEKMIGQTIDFKG